MGTIVYNLHSQKYIKLHIRIFGPIYIYFKQLGPPYINCHNIWQLTQLWANSYYLNQTVWTMWISR